MLNFALFGTIEFSIKGRKYQCEDMRIGQGHMPLWRNDWWIGGENCTRNDKLGKDTRGEYHGLRCGCGSYDIVFKSFWDTESNSFAVSLLSSVQHRYLAPVPDDRSAHVARLPAPGPPGAQRQGSSSASFHYSAWRAEAASANSSEHSGGRHVEVDGSQLPPDTLRGAQRQRDYSSSISNGSQSQNPSQPRRRDESPILLAAHVVEPSVSCTSCRAWLNWASLAGAVICSAFCFALRLTLASRYTLPRFPDASTGLASSTSISLNALSLAFAKQYWRPSPSAPHTLTHERAGPDSWALVAW